jgi:hypothetical protein
MQQHGAPLEEWERCNSMELPWRNGSKAGWRCLFMQMLRAGPELSVRSCRARASRPLTTQCLAFTILSARVR